MEGCLCRLPVFGACAGLIAGVTLGTNSRNAHLFVFFASPLLSHLFLFSAVVVPALFDWPVLLFLVGQIGLVAILNYRLPSSRLPAILLGSSHSLTHVRLSHMPLGNT